MYFYTFIFYIAKRNLWSGFPIIFHKMFLLTFRRKYCICVLEVPRESNGWSMKYITILENFKKTSLRFNDHFNTNTQSQSTSKRSLSHMHIHMCAHEHVSNSLLSGRKSARYFRNPSGVIHTPRVEDGNAFKVPISTAHNWSQEDTLATIPAALQSRAPAGAEGALKQPSGREQLHSDSFHRVRKGENSSR